MALKIGILINSISELRPGRESTVAISDEIENRGHQTLFAPINTGMVDKDGYRASFTQKEYDDDKKKFVSTGFQQKYLKTFDCILFRPDPPVDLQYLHDLNLCTLDRSTKIFNPVDSLLTLNEKTSIFHLSEEIRPLSVCSRSPKKLIDFMRKKECEDWIAKPIDDFGGSGVDRIRNPASELAFDMLKLKTNHGEKHLMVQEFLPEISEGDKRVILVDGEVAGFANRVPAEGSYLANHHAGAHYEDCQLTDRETSVLQRVGELLKDHNIFLSGVDLVGEKVIEINITSPGSLVGINNVTGGKIQTEIVDRLLSKL